MWPDFGKYNELIYTCYGASLLVILALVLHIFYLRRQLKNGSNKDG